LAKEAHSQANLLYKEAEKEYSSQGDVDKEVRASLLVLAKTHER
jgi:hypothetical protein